MKRATTFEGEEGDVLRYSQLVYRGWKGASEIVRSGDNFVVDGEVFTPVGDDLEDDGS